MAGLVRRAHGPGRGPGHLTGRVAGAARRTGRRPEIAARPRPDIQEEPFTRTLTSEGARTRARIVLGGAEVAAVDLVAAVFGRVADEAVRVAGGPLGDVTVTCPVGWGASRRALPTPTAAATAAGLGPVTLVAEPVAAAHAFAGGLAVDAHVVVYDFGAGTFDASVVRRTADGFEVLAERGLADTGGLDVDAAVVAYLGTVTAARATVRTAGDAPERSVFLAGGASRTPLAATLPHQALGIVPGRAGGRRAGRFARVPAGRGDRRQRQLRDRGQLHPRRVAVRHRQPRRSGAAAPAGQGRRGAAPPDRQRRGAQPERPGGRVRGRRRRDRQGRRVEGAARPDQGGTRAATTRSGSAPTARRSPSPAPMAGWPCSARPAGRSSRSRTATTSCGCGTPGRTRCWRPAVTVSGRCAPRRRRPCRAVPCAAAPWRRCRAAAR
ncbi:Hsp70 family protein [Dactylosporangium aurantiacum]|uniref:Hsp70 family protein n=1 Tax=Dactylosporangium aurantiacum TaxID=35754 RepID=A0A9Q9MNU7_9ACTN|nr:Hsp70 family protein [Dactylosporangium aurantiacum]